MMRGLSGYVCVRNGDQLDYCWRESVDSILPVCDEVIICDSDSTDGTRESAEQWASKDPRIRVVNYPFPNPVGDHFWYDKWVNFARKFLRYDMQLSIDADEILEPTSLGAVKEAALLYGRRYFRYVNFWGDARHTTPWGDQKKPQLAPTFYYMPSHADVPSGEKNIRLDATLDQRLVLYHYGALRKREAFYEKSAVLGLALQNCGPDPAIKKALDTGTSFADHYTDRPLSEFKGTHPEVIRQWLKERGHIL